MAQNVFNCTVCNLSCSYNKCSICCDECNNWTHLSCTKLSVNRFKLLSKPQTPFYCDNCYLKSMCPICCKSCKENQNCICCDLCDKWLHYKCISLKMKEFKEFANTKSKFMCSKCCLSQLPFSDLSDFSLKILFNDCYISQFISSAITSNSSYISPKDYTAKFYKKRNFYILSINIRSLNKNFYKLEELIESLEFQPDVITVSETWITNNKVLLYKLKNYNFLHNNCSTKAGGSGIFIKTALNYNVLESLSLNQNKCEDIWIEVLCDNKKKIVIGSVYRHPGNDAKNFQTKLVCIFQKLNQSNTDFIVAGDMNIDLKLDNKHVNKFKNEVLSLGCIQTVNHHTRIVQRNKNSLLDHVYTNLNENELKTNTLAFDISDHLPNLTCISSFKFRSLAPQNKIYVRDHSKFDSQCFLADLQYELTNLEMIGNSEKVWTSFESIFSLVLDKHAPLRQQNRKERKRSKKPWLTKGILKSIKTKHKLFKEVINSPFKDTLDWTLFKRYRNKLTQVTNLSKKIYFKQEIARDKNNTKKLWQTINNIVNLKETKKRNEVFLADSSGETVVDPDTVSNMFNDFFTNVGKNLSDNIMQPRNKDITATTNVVTCKSSFFMSPLTSAEVQRHILALNHNKSIKSTCPPIKYLKLSAKVISPVVCEIFNKCMDEGVFPKSLKTAEVIPIFKKGDKTLCSNYRPISLLPPLSKVFERHIHNNLTSFIKKNSILHRYQYGFRENHSTEMALAELCDLLASNMEENLITCTIFVDLCKAFDTVNHTILLEKLNSCGIRGLSNKLIASYLTNRTQETTVNNKTSSPKLVNCGVPQGSILGPLLFLLYVNDLPRCSMFDVRLFADDACLLLSDANTKQLETKVNTELKQVDDWMKINKLSLNFTKTNYMIFSKKRKKAELEIKIDNKTIERVSNTKYLGVILNEKLKWNAHIDYVLCKVSKASYVISKARHYVNLATLKMLYYSLVFPFISYCITSWGNTPKSTIEPLCATQRKILRYMTFSDFQEHAPPLFKKLNFLTINDIFKYKLSILFYKMKNNSPVDLTEISQVHQHNTRLSASKNFYQEIHKTNIGSYRFKNAAVRIWREIPTAIKSLELRHFKSQLKKHLKNQYSSLGSH